MKEAIETNSSSDQNRGISPIHAVFNEVFTGIIASMQEEGFTPNEIESYWSLSNPLTEPQRDELERRVVERKAGENQ